MKGMTSLLSFMAAALRYSGHLVSVIDEPLAQAASTNGPVPTGLVALVGALFGSTIEAVACPSKNGRLASGFFRFLTPGSLSRKGIAGVLWKRVLSLFGLAVS